MLISSRGCEILIQMPSEIGVLIVFKHTHLYHKLGHHCEK